MNNEDVLPGYGSPEHVVENIVFFEADEGASRLFPPQNLHRHRAAACTILENQRRRVERNGFQQEVDANGGIPPDASDLPEVPDVLIQEDEKDLFLYFAFHHSHCCVIKWRLVGATAESHRRCNVTSRATRPLYVLPTTAAAIERAPGSQRISAPDREF